MTSSRLIGRAAELAELEAALRDAADGRPSLAFVAGESGVGKSRLVAELARPRGRAGRDRRVRRAGRGGAAVRPDRQRPPHARPRRRPRARRAARQRARAELATLLPELGGEARDGGGGTHGQPQLFEALLTLLDQLGREQPFALVLEDIHWADRSTRAFLVFLARSLWTERVLVIATYRSDELHRRHPLRPLLAELERDTRSRRIELARLSREELGDLLADILGGAADAELLERLYTRSEGNPLFTEELLAARLDGRGGLPSTLRDALMVRIERLSQPAQEVLRVLSAGRVLAHAVLAEASGLDAAEVRAALREAAESNVIVADQRGRYQFRHALLREVVHDDLLPGEHAELHLALARALEHQAAETGEDALITAGIAHHYLQAGAQREALVASVRAADAAERVHAHGEAGALLERALELWPRVPDAATEAGCDRDEPAAPRGPRAHQRRRLRARGGAAAGRGRRHRRRRRAAPGGRPARAAVARAVVARARHRLARVARPRDRAAAGERPQPRSARGSSRGRRRRRCCRGASARRCPPPRRRSARRKHANADGPLADALNAMGHSQILLGEVEDGSARLREAIAISPRGFERTSAWTNLADALHIVGRSQEGLAAAEQGLADTAFEGRVSDWLSLDAGRHPLGARRLGRRPGRAAAAGQAPHRHDARLRRDAARRDRAGRRRARRGARVARARRRRRDRARASRSSSAGTARCSASSSAAAATSRPRAPRSTTGSTRSSSAPRTCRGSRCCRRPARRSRPTPPSAPATSATTMPSARRSRAPRAS